MIPMSNENIRERISIERPVLRLSKQRLFEENARIYAHISESWADIDTLLEVLGRMRLPENQQKRLVRKIAFNLQPGILASSLQKIYNQLVWLNLFAEEFQEAVETYDISDQEKDDLMDIFL